MIVDLLLFQTKPLNEFVRSEGNGCEKWISCLKTLSKSMLLLQLVESASKPEKLGAIRLDASMGAALFCFVSFFCLFFFFTSWCKNLI